MELKYQKAAVVFSLFSFFYTSGFSQNKDNYFQQKVDHKIEAVLDTAEHKIYATQKINYTNNAPYAITEIPFHLWANAYSDKNSAFANQQLKMGIPHFYFADKKDMGGYTKFRIAEEGETLLNYRKSEHIDIIYVALKDPIETGESRDFLINFELKIPNLYSRFGHENEFYQITQWYPKPAVIDKNGTNEMPYLELGEFYSEFGDYEISITVPANFKIAHTGALSKIDKSADKHCYHILAKNIHDFAWFASPDFSLTQKEMDLNGKSILLNLYRSNNNSSWDNGLQFMENAINFYSQEVGDYPYPQVSVVQGNSAAGSGMEYPMITIIDDEDDVQIVDHLIAHEIGHNWFYSILGFNERTEPWLDEGINTYLEHVYNDLHYEVSNYDQMLPKFLLGDTPLSIVQQSVIGQQRLNKHQSVSCHSEEFSTINYGAMVYEKASWAFRYLEQTIGKKTMRSSLHKLYKKWQHKHLDASDVQEVFEEVSGRDLSFFFDGIIKSNENFDLEIKKVIRTKNAIEVVLKNKSSLAIPASLDAYKNNLLADQFKLAPFVDDTIISLAYDTYDQFIINGAFPFIDNNRKNNNYRLNTLFNKLDPIRFKLFAEQENTNLNQLFYSPYAGYNSYDKFYLGLALYNSTFPQKQFRYIVAPSYSFANKNLVGGFAVEKDFSNKNYGSGKIGRKTTIGIAGRKFDFQNGRTYQKLAPFVRRHFQQTPASTGSSFLELKSHLIWEQKSEIDGHKFRPIIALNYHHKNRFLLTPSQFSIGLEYQEYTNGLEANHNYLKLEANYKAAFMYKKRKKFFYRLYAGGFLKNTQRNSASFANQLTIGSIGITDQGFLDNSYTDLYFGRNQQSGLASNQINLNQGGFKTALGSAFNVGLTNNYLLSLNLKTDLPLGFTKILPLRPFIDMAYTSTKQLSSQELKGNFLYSAGLSLEFGDGVFGIYLPLFNSKSIEDGYIGESNYLNRLSFTIQLTKLNLWRIIDETDI